MTINDFEKDLISQFKKEIIYHHISFNNIIVTFELDRLFDPPHQNFFLQG